MGVSGRMEAMKLYGYQHFRNSTKHVLHIQHVCVALTVMNQIPVVCGAIKPMFRDVPEADRRDSAYLHIRSRPNHKFPNSS